MILQPLGRLLNISFKAFKYYTLRREKYIESIIRINPNGFFIVSLYRLNPEKSYFLQLCAYSTRLLAEKLAQNLQKTYTIAVLPVTAESRLFYRVLIGPLNRDESGTLLYNFRSLGFKDAFIKYVD